VTWWVPVLTALLGALFGGLVGHHLAIVRTRTEESRKQAERHARFKNVLVIDDVGRRREFTWAGFDPVEELPESEPRQLYEFAEVLVSAIREYSKLEPVWSIPDRLAGEPVFELNAERTLRWRLLGGGQQTVPGHQILVITNRPASRR